MKHQHTPTPTPALVISTSVLVGGKPLTCSSIRTLISTEKSRHNSAFEASLMLAQAVYVARDYYEAHKGTELLKAHKIGNLNDFWLKCGFTKAQIEANYVKQLCKAGSATPEQIATYKDTARKEGSQIGVKGLCKWLSGVQKAVEAGATQEDAEAQASVGVAKTGEPKAKSPFVMNADLSFFGLGDTHVKVHVHPDGTMDTNVSPEEFLRLATLIAEAMRSAKAVAA